MLSYLETKNSRRKVFLIIGMSRADEKEQYERFLSGSNEAFEKLVLTYKDGLILFINRLVHNITIAEDLAQDAFVEVFVHKERYNYETSFKTYLYTIGRNKAVDYIRKNQRLMFVDEYPDAVREEASLEEKVIVKEEKQMIYHAMKQLKKEYQTAIVLIDFEELSYADAAKILDKTNGQMKVLIHRARKSLAKVLSREGFKYEK